MLTNSTDIVYFLDDPVCGSGQNLQVRDISYTRILSPSTSRNIINSSNTREKNIFFCQLVHLYCIEKFEITVHQCIVHPKKES